MYIYIILNNLYVYVAMGWCKFLMVENTDEIGDFLKMISTT